MDRILLQAQEEGWSREELEILLGILDDAKETPREGKRRRGWLHGACALAIGLCSGGLLWILMGFLRKASG